MPSLLIELSAQGRWCHPGNDTLRRLAPFIHEELELVSIDSLCPGLSLLDRDAAEDSMFCEYRGSLVSEPRQLPWIDVEQTVLIAVNKMPGDDVALGLDYRANSTDPPVVANDWHGPSPGCIWREVARSFSEFCMAAGLLTKNHRPTKGWS